MEKYLRMTDKAREAECAKRSFQGWTDKKKMGRKLAVKARYLAEVELGVVEEHKRKTGQPFEDDPNKGADLSHLSAADMLIFEEAKKKYEGKTQIEIWKMQRGFNIWTQRLPKERRTFTRASNIRYSALQVIGMLISPEGDIAMSPEQLEEFLTLASSYFDQDFDSVSLNTQARQLGWSNMWSNKATRSNLDFNLVKFMAAKALKVDERRLPAFY